MHHDLPPSDMPASAHKHRRRTGWHDGDTMLIFGALVLVCGVMILVKVLNPDNWVILGDAPATVNVAIPVECVRADVQQ